MNTNSTIKVVVKEEDGRRFPDLISILVDFILNDDTARNITDDEVSDSVDYLSNYGSLVAIEVINRITYSLRSGIVNQIGMIPNICQFFANISTKNPFLVGIIQQSLMESTICLKIEQSNSEQNEDNTRIISQHIKSLRVLLCNGCIGNILRSEVDIETIVKYSMSPNRTIRYYSFSFICEFFKLSPFFKSSILQKSLHNEDDPTDCLMGKLLLNDIESNVIKPYYQNMRENISNSNHTNSQIDNIKTVISELNAIASTIHDVNSLNQSPYLSKGIVNIAGYVLNSYRLDKWVPQIVATKSTIENMKRLAEAILTAKPVILQGGVGCGKSFLIRELADAMGLRSNLIEMHLNDQTETKALIGSYVCSDIPGEFVWQNGLLTNAVLQGQWIVIEDIDKAPIDFIASIATLLEYRKLYLPHRNMEIDAHPSFRIIATRIFDLTTYKNKDTVGVNELNYNSLLYIANLRHFSNLWHFVCVVECSLEEIEIILVDKFPSIPITIIHKLMKVYDFFKNEFQTKASEYIEIESTDIYKLSQLKEFTLRELIKVLKRIQTYTSEFNTTSGYLTDMNKRKTLQEVIDIFVGSLRDASLYNNVVQLIGKIWDVASSDISTFFLGSNSASSNDLIHVENNHSNGDTVKIGRVILQLENKSQMSFEGTINESFASTKHSLIMLEKVAMSVFMSEPVLLVGETGSGKTTSIQELAAILNKKLLVQNLSLSTDVSDLFGGFKPVSMKQLLLPAYETFVKLFQATLSASQNNDFLQVVAQFFNKQKWQKLVQAFKKAADNAIKKLESAFKNNTSSQVYNSRLVEWIKFSEKISRYEVNLSKIESGFAFSFTEGMLMKAIRNGMWILLDEINLASSETLQGLSGIFDTDQSIFFTEEGDIEPIKKHPEFRVFAAMNPPTDIGKKELPLTLRGRFTEFYSDEMTNPLDLMLVVEKYLRGIEGAPVEKIIQIYLNSRALSKTTLVDGAGLRPHFSLRSLTRSLTSARNFLDIGLRPFGRALYEAFRINFSNMLSDSCRQDMNNYLKQQLCPQDNNKDLDFPPPRPGGRKSEASDWVLIKPFWLRSGRLDSIDWAVKDANGVIKHVMTKTVESNIRDLASSIAAGVAPILLQGPTSVGKTSMIEYVARRLGHKCVRINNHEHTDVQEYIGGYITNANGQLEFRDGLLVEAVRLGNWIILDELNLAPSDVLEALNRLLDDNKEILIPETGEIVKPSNGFQLFATQNPPGIYGGRKPLSRAFKNRFLELNVSDLPLCELEQIVTESCGIAPKFSAMLVKSMHEIQIRRQNSSIFQGKYASITTRDLIKWGRRALVNAMNVAVEGYMLIAEKLRSEEEKQVINNILNDVCHVNLIPGNCYLSDASSSPPHEIKIYEIADLSELQNKLRLNQVEVEGIRGVAITETMRRMWTLVGRCFSFDEPALIIGETGCGKTTICQLLAAYRGQKILILNCHQSTETADIIGSLRPVRGREAIKVSLVEMISELLNMLFTNFKSDDISDLEYSNKLSQQINEKVLFDDTIIKKTLDEISLYINNYSDSRSPSKKIKIDVENAPCEDIVLNLIDMHAKVVAQWIRFVSLFEWQDGPLVTAMKEGYLFLIDEINLAADAVIERLNSVLESGREITLAEKGGLITEKLIAHPNFKLVATMNPGGDFGKRELSPALRSRFTEIWVPTSNNSDDLVLTVSEILHIDILSASDIVIEVAKCIVIFSNWIRHKALKLSASSGLQFSTREIIAWSKFISQCDPKSLLQLYCCYVHGAHVIFLDGFGVGLSLLKEDILGFKIECLSFLLSQCPSAIQNDIKKYNFMTTIDSISEIPLLSDSSLTVGNFSIPFGIQVIPKTINYVFNARSTILNLGRVLRAMQLRRPILLEGSPGVGKSSLISNLASLSGNKLVRINLSEHSELSDLLGTDLPISSDGPSSDEDCSYAEKFKWFDGVFLTAMKNGDWVLLDELNLAPQSVLEGLNACFDHRGEVFLPEIGITFTCSPNFRVFCAQNQMSDGGGRKGLPQSFLSRFSKVFVEPISESDLLGIASNSLNVSSISEKNQTELLSFIPLMVKFVLRLHEDIVEKGLYCTTGGPWEFNLRDIFRWCEMLKTLEISSQVIADVAYTLFVSRMRTVPDRNKVCDLFQFIFGFKLEVDISPSVKYIDDNKLMIGSEILAVRVEPSYFYHNQNLYNSHNTSDMFASVFSKQLEMIAHCINFNWPVLLVGPSSSGKRKSIQHLASLTGNRVIYFSASSSTDTIDLLGSFEQVSAISNIYASLEYIERAMMEIIKIQLSIYNCDPESRVLINAVDILKMFRKVFNVANSVAKNNRINLEGGTQLINEVEELIHACWNIFNNLKSSTNQFIQDNLVESLLTNALTELQKSCHLRAQKSTNFAWMDGIVLHALEIGQWLVVENVNLCSASVLDRLNSLLEPNGSLLLTENGVGKVIIPHKDFRIFFTMDPSVGEISRAMRNRCTEIYYIHNSISAHSLVSSAFVRSQRLGFSQGVTNKICDLLTSFQSFSQNLPKFKLLEKVSLLFINNISQGIEYDESMNCAIESMLPGFRNLFRFESSSLVKEGCLMNITVILSDYSIFSKEIAVALYLLLFVSSSNSKSFSLTPWIHAIFKEAVDRMGSRDVLNNDKLLNILSKMKGDESLISAIQLQNHCMVLLLSILSLEVPHVRSAVEKILSKANLMTNYLFIKKILDLYNDLLLQVISQIPNINNHERSSLMRLERIYHLGFNKYQDKVGMMLLLHHESINIDLFDTKYTVLKLWTELVGILVNRRIDLIKEEYEVKEVKSKGIVTIYNLAYAIYVGKICADSRELAIVGALYKILILIDDLIWKMLTILAAIEITKETVNFVRAIVENRDFLFQTMNNSKFGADYSNITIPWDSVSICINWIKKSIKQLSNTESRLVPICEDALFDILNFIRLFNEYWCHNVITGKIRVWKECGHCAVPVRSNDWKRLFKIRQMISSVHKPLPSFVDTVTDRIYNLENFYIRDSYLILKEWLCLYSTFYWAYTNETNSKGLWKPNKVIDIDTLIMGFEDKMKSHLLNNSVSDINLDNNYSDYMDSNPELFIYNKNIHDKILVEKEFSGDHTIALIYEIVIIKLLYHITDDISKFVLYSSHQNFDMSSLIAKVKCLIDVSLRYSMLSALCFRELQTLLWCMQSDENRSSLDYDKNAILQSILSLLRPFLVSLESRIASMLQNNLMNILPFLTFSYSSYTSTKILSSFKAKEISIDGPLNFSSINTGSLRLLECVRSEVNLKHIDIKVIYPTFSGSRVFQSLNTNRNCAEITISSHAYCVRNMFRLFRANVEGSLIIQNYSDDKFDINRLSLLSLNVFDIISSCRDFLPEIVYNNFMDIQKIEKKSPLYLQFKALDKFNISSIDMNSHLKYLFEKCISPIIKVLANEDIHKTPNEPINLLQIARCWVLIGIAKFHMVIPLVPVDPAVKPTLKHAFLGAKIENIRRFANVLSTHKSMCGSMIADYDTFDIEQIINNTTLKREKLFLKGIERPENSESFLNLYNELRDSVRTLVNLDKLTKIIENLSDAYAQNSYCSHEDVESSVREEGNIQSSLYHFSKRLEDNYAEFEDIISPALAAIANISHGLRLIAGHSHHLYLQRSTNTNSQIISHVWSNILQFPFSATIRLTEDLIIKNDSIDYIVDLVKLFEKLIVKSVYNLNQVSMIADKTELTENLTIESRHAILLQSLSRIDYLVGGGTISSFDIYEPFKSILNEFASNYLKSESNKKIRMDEKNSLYKNKMNEAVYESDIVKEEEESFRMHFPNYSTEMELLAKSEINEDFNQVNDDPSNKKISDESLIDEYSTLSIVSIHCRLIFMYMNEDLLKNNLIWRKRNSSYSYDTISWKKSLQHSLSLCTLLTSKLLSDSMTDLLSPDLDSTLSGGSLMTLSVMINKSGVDCLQHENSSFTLRKKNIIDRDLLFLLENNSMMTHGSINKSNDKFPSLPINFHFDPNPYELVKVFDCLEKLLFRSSELLEMFPGNELLSHVCLVCMKLSDYHITTPVGKMLMSVELLLSKAQEWELVAARHVSLSREMGLLRDLIHRWREIELISWGNLLRSKEITYAKKALKFWFNLSRIFSHEPIIANDKSATKEEKNKLLDWSCLSDFCPSWLYSTHITNSDVPLVELEGEKDSKNIMTDIEIEGLVGKEMKEIDYLKKIFDIVDTLMRTSNVGEFPMRLHLLRLFALQLKQECLLPLDTSIIRNRNVRMRLSCLLSNVWKYYDQFLPVVRNFQDTLMEPIQQKLKDEVKISKWDDLNTYAVIDHSEKVHRKLSKFIREYESEVMEFPVHLLLRRDIMKDFADDKGELTPSTSIPSDNIMFPLRVIFNESVEEDSDNDAANKILSNFQSSSDLISPDFIPSYLILSESERLKYAKIFQINSLYKRIDKYLKQSLYPQQYQDNEELLHYEGTILYGFKASEISENIGSKIFAHLKFLREMSPETSNKQVKIRAISDLLKELRFQGISHLKSDAPINIRDNFYLLSSNSPFATEILADFEWSSRAPRDFFEKAESYYNRNLVELSQLRVQSRSVISKDISSRDSSQMVSISDNFLSLVLKLRSAVGASMKDYHNLFSIHSKITSITKGEVVNSFHVSTVKIVEKYLDLNIKFGNVLLDNFIQIRILAKTAAESYDPKNVESNPILQIETSNIKSCLLELDNLIKLINESFVINTDEDINSEEDLTLFPTYISDFTVKPLREVTSLSLQRLGQQDAAAEKINQAFNTIYKRLVDLVSSEILNPIRNQIQEFVTSVKNNFYTVQSKITNLDWKETSDCDQEDINGRAIIAQSSKLIDSCLISIQNIRALPHISSESEDSAKKLNIVGCFGEEINCTLDDSTTLNDYISLTSVAVASLKTDVIVTEATTLYNLFISYSDECLSKSRCPYILRDIQSLIERLNPLLLRIIKVEVLLIDSLIRSYKSASKLLYISLRIFRTLLAKGICSDNTEDSEGNGDTNGMTFEDNVEGTGMGEGAGMNDVSDQIENEEQLLGLKNDNPDDNEKTKNKESKTLEEKEKDKGVEMTQDFDGDLFDIPEDQEDEESQDSKEESKEDEEEAEREMGDANLEDVVDEKQWGDSDDEEEKGDDQKEKFEKDSKMKGEAIEGEMRTKEGEEDMEKENGDKKENDEDENKNKDLPEEDEEGKINADEEDNYMDKQFDVDKKNEQKKDEAGEEDPQGDKEEDFPEEMNIEDNQIENTADEENMDQTDEKEANSLADDENVEDKSEDNNAEDLDGADGTNINGSGDPAVDNVPEIEEEENKDLPPELGNKNQSERTKEMKATFGVQSNGGNESLLNSDNMMTDEVNADNADKQLDNNGGSKGKGGGISQSEGLQGESRDIGNVNNDQSNNAPPASRKYNEPPNPFKEKGDINESWHRRLNLVNNETETSINDDNADEKNNPSDHYEHSKKEDGGNEQVLSDALEEDHVPVPQSGELTNSKESKEFMDVEDEDQPLLVDDRDEEKQKETIKKNSNNDKKKTLGDDMSSKLNKEVQQEEEMEVDEDLESVASQDEQQQMELDEMSEQNLDKKIFSDSDFRFGRSGINVVSNQLVVENNQIITTISDELSLSYDLWFQHKNKNEAYSNRLCEQLRLVLEPTLATRLQGDYRNGKRINMRRVIPYVASGFRKDKIWLRRTKPAKRDYQVLIMIDDSSSMGDAGNLALSALCCISNALTRLEIGDLCVASFADTFKVLHSFGKPFTDESGARVFSQFKFAAGSTLLASSLEAVGPIFETARNARIDSENRDKLERTVRTLSEKHILVVLVIVDRNKDSNNSIFNTKTVSFKGNKVVTSSYFDSFPFPYYVAIQKPEVLPELLSDALRQWFELIRLQAGDS